MFTKFLSFRISLQWGRRFWREAARIWRGPIYADGWGEPRVEMEGCCKKKEVAVDLGLFVVLGALSKMCKACVPRDRRELVR